MKKIIAIFFTIVSTLSYNASSEEYIYKISYGEKPFASDRCFPLSDLKDDIGKSFKMTCIEDGSAFYKCAGGLFSDFYVFRFPNKKSCQSSLFFIKRLINGDKSLFDNKQPIEKKL